MQRMHNPDREAKKADRIHRSKTLKLKVPTTDFESFMFKCRVCMMGFRRRGMLVSYNSQRDVNLILNSSGRDSYSSGYRLIICPSVIQRCVLMTYLS